MDEAGLEKVTEFVRPLYLDLDGASGMAEVDRVSRLARSLFLPSSDQERFRFELLLLFQGLQRWLEKVGSFSRTTLTLRGVITEEDLGETLRSLRRLDSPQSPAERALAAGRLIHDAGVLGLAHALSRARREGSSLEEVSEARLIGDDPPPDWMSEPARGLLLERRERARRICEELLDELRMR